MKETLTVRITRGVFVLVIGCITILGDWLIDRWYDLQLWYNWKRLR